MILEVSLTRLERATSRSEASPVNPRVLYPIELQAQNPKTLMRQSNLYNLYIVIVRFKN